jgi:lysophospholipase L1-like esterase
MRFRLVTLSLILALCALSLAQKTFGQTYYVALGDSLATGYQPGDPTDTPNAGYGYADYLEAQLVKSRLGLQLVKLGCFGETTTSMIQGGMCSLDPAGDSQLDQAVNFLETHAQQVVLVTLDIGANDVDHCISTSGIDTTCIQTGFASVGSNLPWILRRLRQAAGPHTPIIGMNYYDPFLAAWALGKSGQALALQSLAATTDFNVLLGALYAVFNVPVADVAQAFRTYNLLPVPGENEPVDVFVVLAWTWMSLPTPDIHPTSAGYAAIAGAFASKISP